MNRDDVCTEEDYEELILKRREIFRLDISA